MITSLFNDKVPKGDLKSDGTLYRTHNLLGCQWDAEASERRELAAKKAALASAEIAKFSKCVSGIML